MLTTSLHCHGTAQTAQNQDWSVTESLNVNGIIDGNFKKESKSPRLIIEISLYQL